MSISAAACCVAVTQQRQDHATCHYYQRHENSQPCDPKTVTPCNPTTQYCTVVENGRVVVKPISG